MSRRPTAKTRPASGTFVSPKVAADMVNLSPDQVLRLADGGAIGTDLIRGSLYVRLEDVQMITANEKATTGREPVMA